MFYNNQVRHRPETSRVCISLAEGKTEARIPQKETETNDSKDLAEHCQHLVMLQFQTSGSDRLQMTCNQLLKLDL